MYDVCVSCLTLLPVVYLSATDSPVTDPCSALPSLTLQTKSSSSHRLSVSVSFWWTFCQYSVRP